MGCVELPFLVLGTILLGFVFVGLWALIIIGPLALTAWWIWTTNRRAMIRERLRCHGWPSVILLPDLLTYRDATWRRLPQYDAVCIIPGFNPILGRRRLLWKTLDLVDYHRQITAELPEKEPKVVPGQ